MATPRETMQDPDGFTPVRILPDARRLGEGDAARFEVRVDGVARGAFVVRYRGPRLTALAVEERDGALWCAGVLR